ncbi:MAG: response regulator [Betaproteobacteria bacterium]|nr:response regulator [Betaproteobacteria bacterium]
MNHFADNSMMKIVFVVDDIDTNRASAKLALDDTYRTFTLPSAEKMFSLAEKIRPDLILLDIDMPEMDGFEAIQLLKANPRLRSIPVIFLTAQNDTVMEIRGFELGALDFISKPFSPPVLLKRVEMHIEADKLMKNAQRSAQVTYNATINALADAMESKNSISSGHVMRTQAYVKLLVNELIRTGTYAEEVSKWDRRQLIPSSQLHDVGKIAISDTILNKSDKLNEAEFENVKQHCREGERIIERIIDQTKDDSFLLHAKNFVSAHHEKWDGTGYPRKLAGEEIPLEGRIMAIADVYDALITDRPYRKAVSHEDAVQIIEEGSGTHFDPKLVEAFQEVAKDFWRQSLSVKN